MVYVLVLIDLIVSAGWVGVLGLWVCLVLGDFVFCMCCWFSFVLLWYGW